MSTTTDTTPTTEQDAATEAPATATDEQSAGKGSEAAKWRSRLRATEQERDALAARLVTLQEGEVRRLVADRLADADDLAVYGTHTADLLDDDGNVDPAKVEAAVDALVERKPRLAKDWEPDAEGLDGGARQSVSRGSGATWGSLVSGRDPQR